jgi:hypothetical protein
LAAFRVLFGVLMAAAMVRFMAKGWVQQCYIEPSFYFAYPGLEWIRPWPGALMHAHFVLLVLLALGVAFGFFYRVCITLFFLGFTYVELIDQTTYLNHYYLISLLSGVMIFLPANRAWSVDAWRRPELLPEAVPAWTLNILRFQVAVVYVFAGLAKLNADWLFRAQPLRIWLAARSDLALIGPWLAEPWVAYAASWFGAVFDTTIVLFLLNRRTRGVAYGLVTLFHVATWILFNIGMFPWIMIVAATLFFPANWPRPWLRRLGQFVSDRFKSNRSLRHTNVMTAIQNPPGTAAGSASAIVLLSLTIYAAAQLALPLRSYFASQPVAWTCSGFNCAWRVMIAEKRGFAEFNAFDRRTGRSWKLPAQDYLTPRQQVMVAQDPYLIRATARHLAADLKNRGLADVEIRVDAFATINGRPSRRLINSDIDLAGRLPPDWILPLED